jgi:hypothetical protein
MSQLRSANNASSFRISLMWNPKFPTEGFLVLALSLWASLGRTLHRWITMWRWGSLTVMPYPMAFIILLHLGFRSQRKSSQYCTGPLVVDRTVIRARSSRAAIPPGGPSSGDGWRGLSEAKSRRIWQISSHIGILNLEVRISRSEGSSGLDLKDPILFQLDSNISIQLKKFCCSKAPLNFASQQRPWSSASEGP